jgi:hypothetical protein
MSHPPDPHAVDEPDTPQAGPEVSEPPVGEGEDDHVILWMLSLTPTQRLEVAQGFVDSVRMLKNGLRS